MTDDTIAALEWAARCAGQFAAEQRPFGPSANLAANEKRAALIRAHIETLRAGGERAQIVAWLRKEAIMSTDSVRRRMNKAVDQIAAGAHK